ncbi:CrtD protein [Aestuariivirga litoralis]|uniref:CrtD protein n=1 Tax=Aestuariivirga litoralis TaxID=2650924 RepID=A0A2W2B7K0_9HYPH|nr:1-hydroxycarotenoid 3,4-desaturase CrtD [Aestuariivirga litoralis]PZF76048.1 CrtD protein [Aestuariivirga litoralis]
MPRDRIIIIGAGMGGLAAALSLASQGEEVLVIERQASPGGKMRRLAVGGQGIDGGPTVFTMRWVLEQVFAEAGADVSDHVTLEPLAVLARHAWSPSERLDLHADLAASADAIGTFAGAGEARRFIDFSAEAKRIYQTLEKPFLRSQRPNPVSLAMSNGLSGMMDVARINPFETMWKGLARHFRDPRLQQLFGRYATYCGSSPFLAPATLMLVAHVEQAGVWSVRGGMHELALALDALARHKGVSFRYGEAVTGIGTEGGRVAWVSTATERFDCTSVIVNADAQAVATGLLGGDVKPAVTPIQAEQRSLSAITWAAVAETSGFPLARHNVFFSRDYEEEFRTLSTGYPGEPTVYVCAQDREGHGGGPERLLLLVNSPANGDHAPQPLARVEVAMRAKLAQCGLSVDFNADTTIITDPARFDALFPATGGALYGRASHGWMASFQRPAARTKIPGLYLAGGSVHPGPGVPMAMLSGRLAAQSLLASRVSTRRSRRGATVGGISTA